ncbi:DUF3618 domain-containing protein [Actinomycetospora lemnae]|uniref:DUF3618 domain-containing protein n=1 Tax=Actinomycetospora lemnae TaxID=3019891 RepID=A0ABT5SZV2_9PSEU|nr:DUF3618 domain-containing protein [Actinomycetospora sp. DW7H6]MDD7968393.1 DUF3618 domain-containing protein [Actinomycetospora sp. DW7H6]
MTTPGPETPTGARAPRPGPQATQEELIADIEATRAELGDTVDALTQKLDVKAQARESLEDAKQRASVQFRQAKDAATDEHGNLTPQARAIAIKVAAAVAGLVVVRAVWKKVRG